MSPSSIGFLGGGNMGEALISAVLSITPTLSVGVLEINPDRLIYLKKTFPTISILSTQEDLARCDTVIIAIKPQQFKQAIASLTTSLEKETLVISIVAGISLATLEHAFPGCDNVRVMPNTPALIGKGMTGLVFGLSVSTKRQEFVKAIFSSIGLVEIVHDELMDAITAISGSGPAYFYYLIDIMATEAKTLGLTYDLAATLLTQTMVGSAMMIQITKKSPADLINQVTSPGGTTEAAMKMLIDSDIKSIWHKAFQSAHKRAKELSKL